MIYDEPDVQLALIKDDDWLSDPAGRVFRAYEAALWTAHLTPIELLLVAYREDRNDDRPVTDASALLALRGDEERVLAAASYVSDRGLTPFDARHAVASAGDPIVSSARSSDDVTGTDRTGSAVVAIRTAYVERVISLPNAPETGSEFPLVNRYGPGTRQSPSVCAGVVYPLTRLSPGSSASVGWRSRTTTECASRRWSVRQERTHRSP